MRFIPLRALIVLAGLALAASSVRAQPTLGFREDFPDSGDVNGWASAAIVSNPGTGGLDGLDDGYLVVTRNAPGQLGARSEGSWYVGDWTTTGITQIRLWLTDHGVDDPLEIHVGIGTTANFWQYDPGFLPPLGQWAEFVVDLGPANWTQIINLTGGTFTEALQNATRILIRHDHAPYVQTPDNLQGDFGIDHILLTNGLVGVPDFASVAQQPIELAAPFPNPSRGPVTLSIAQREAGRVRIEVVDIGGRRVRAAELPAAGTGPRLWMWDGRDDRGARVPPGAYRVRAFGATGGTSRALVRID